MKGMLLGRVILFYLSPAKLLFLNVKCFSARSRCVGKEVMKYKRCVPLQLY